MNEMKSDLHDEYYLNLLLYKLSLPEEWVLKAYNFGVPIYKGVIPHDFNEINHFTVITV